MKIKKPFYKISPWLIIISAFVLLLSFSYVKSIGIQRQMVAGRKVPTIIHEKAMPIREALKFCKTKKFDTTLAIFINYHKHSGKKRLYIIDLQKGIIQDSFMVSHGCGSSAWGTDGTKDHAQFSNEPESHCSSSGKYRIGKRAYSDWGIHVKYFMYGLDKTNSNAYKRTIVLHGWGDVPDDETYPNGVPEGWGCPAVSDNTMTRLDGLLSERKKPVLLWVY